ncbi:hypothetical protein D3C86_2203700 [compost metagenome]
MVSAGIGLAFLADIPFIREGTVLNAVLVGQYIRLYFFLYKKLQARKAAPSSNRLEPAAK